MILDALMVPSLLLYSIFLTIILVFCCSCDLLLLAASHEGMENVEVALFDTAGMVEQTSCGPGPDLGSDWVFKENAVLMLLS